MDFATFILEQQDQDLGRLALARDRYLSLVPDFDLALTTLEVRAKLRRKVPEWYAVPALRYPLRISGEQCSSSATARYKAAVALAACRAAAAPGSSDYANTAQNALPAPLEGPGLREKGQKCVMPPLGWPILPEGWG